MNPRKKRFFASHSKSSVMVVSLVLHAILAGVALSFVAVTVITKKEQNFESKQVVRPRMTLKKLQVPVKIKKQKRKPKMRQRIVVKHQVNRSMPEINVFGVRGKGEKVFIALDTDARIMRDEVGGKRSRENTDKVEGGWSR